MPITPKHLLFSSLGTHALDLGMAPLNKKTVSLITNAIVNNATRYIYADEERDDIPKIRPSQVSLERAKDASYMMRNWDDLQAGPMMTSVK